MSRLSIWGAGRGIHWDVLSFGVSHSMEKLGSSLLPFWYVSEMGCLGSLLSEREDAMQTGPAPLGEHVLGGLPSWKQLSVTALDTERASSPKVASQLWAGKKQGSLGGVHMSGWHPPVLCWSTWYAV